MAAPSLDLRKTHFAYHPRLKLFLSADIIGSTAFKQPLDFDKDPEDTPLVWAEVIQGFYKSVSENFHEHWQHSTNFVITQSNKPDADEDLVSRMIGPEPRFWKTVGDEVIFWKELTNDRQLWMTLACWLKTVESIRDYFDGHRSDAVRALDVKSTVWVAEFPVRNKAVVKTMGSADLPARKIRSKLAHFYRNAQTTQEHIDFIGPGIDVGFRLGKFSSSKKMSISLDVAYLLARSHRAVGECHFLSDADLLPEKVGAKQGTFVQQLQVFYSGSEPLNGVLGGIRYPKFWIRSIRHESLDAANEALYLGEDGTRRTPVEWDHLKTFCQKFYEDRSKFVSRPFILAQDGGPHGAHSDRYQHFLDAVILAEANDKGLSPG